MMPMRPMHMPVRNLFLARRAHVDHLQAEAQLLACPRMFAVEQHLRPLDLHHREGVLAPIACPPLQLPAHFHARRELGLGNGAHQRLVALAETVCGREVQRGLVAALFALQRRLDLTQQSEI